MLVNSIDINSTLCETFLPFPMADTKSIRSTIISWERLRLAFNIVLLIEGLLLSYDLIYVFESVFSWAFWIFVFGATMNAWFSIGPLLEIYSMVFKKRNFGQGRYWLFALFLAVGMIVVLGLAVGTALSAPGGGIFKTP